MKTLVTAILGHGGHGDEPSAVPPPAHPAHADADADAPPAAAAGARVLELDVLGAKVAEAKVGAQARDGAPLGDALAVGGLAGAELADGDVVEVLAHDGSRWILAALTTEALEALKPLTFETCVYVCVFWAMRCDEGAERGTGGEGSDVEGRLFGL